MTEERRTAGKSPGKQELQQAVREAKLPGGQRADGGGQRAKGKGQMAAMLKLRSQSA